MRKFGLIFLLSYLVSLLASGQTVALKTNLLYNAVTVPNLGVEFSVGKHFTVDVSGNYNPWDLSSSRSIRHWQVLPEFRYWPVEKFDGHFFGIHAFYTDYIFKDVWLPMGMKRNQAFDGMAYGAGLSYGYQLYLSTRWSLEFTAGFGYGNYEYDKFSLEEDENAYLGLFRTDYIGVTKLGISITYFLK
ncbi:MAG: DUF3575 domain-containing protein [Tannerellaceae bacterium]|jgi:hypothetical protein|nr:DUF3575 domain-containing protein [Tannerellaceae bacterium]